MEQTPEPMVFDFDEDGGMSAVRKLESILCSSGWSRAGLDFRDERTVLLAQLVRAGGLVIFERRFTLVHDYTDEERSHAGLLSDVCGKRSGSPFLLYWSRLHPGKEPEYTARLHNALFYPELRAYIRCGDLTAEKLFDLFEHEGCDMVAVAPDYVLSNTEGAYYIFCLAIPKAELAAMLESLREKHRNELSEALAQMHEQTGFSPFPSITGLDTRTE